MTDPGLEAAVLATTARPEPARVASGTIVRSEPLGGGALTLAALAGTTPPGWYPPRPHGGEDWRQRVSAVMSRVDRSRWLDELWPAIQPTGPARERLERAAESGVVVTSGQQPGLFGGPVYTWSKAIGVLALADALERAVGVPVAPLFWAATDDADFVEASTTWIAVPGGVEPITAEPLAHAGIVLSAAPLGDLSTPLRRLIDAAGSAPFAAALDAVRTAYAPAAARGATAGDAFVALLRRLLEPLGVSVLDAAHSAVRQRAFPTLVRALERADAVAHALERRSDAITAAGYTPQVSNVPGLSLVFSWHSERAAVAPSADGKPDTVVDDGPMKVRVPVAQARELAARAQPGDLSHNVLLRPIIERAIVPSVAYLGGPSEIAYFAQTSAVAEVLELPPPLILPRWSCTLIEPAAAALLKRYSVTLDDLRDLHGPECRVARAALPVELRAALDALAAAIESGTQAVASADRENVLPRAVVEGARAYLRHRVRHLERRYVAAHKRTEQDAMRDLATLRGALYPTGSRQERVLNFIPLLARGGPPLLDAMHVEATRHAVHLIGGDSSRLP